MRVGVRKQPGEEQRLRDDLGIRIARVPRLYDVDAEQARRRRRRKRADESTCREVHGQDAQNRPPCDHSPRAGHAIQPVRDRNPHRIALRELAGHRTGIRIAQVKPHEANAVVIRILVRRKKQIARRCRDGRCKSVDGDERLPLRDLNALAHVHAGIASAQHVFRCRNGEVHPDAGAISTAGMAAVQPGRRAVAPSRKLPSDASARTAASTTLHHTSTRSEYALIAASANATVVVTMMLMMTDQNRRSSAGSAARFARSANGSRKAIAPGR